MGTDESDSVLGFTEPRSLAVLLDFICLVCLLIYLHLFIGTS